MRRSGRSMNRKGSDRGAEMWLTERTRKLIPETRRGIVLHYWADLQSVHTFRRYDNIASNAKCQRVLVLALCLVNG